MALGGLDIGTSSVKFVVFDEEGNELASTSKEYRLIKERGYEYDPYELWDAIKAAIREGAAAVHGEIEAIGISSMGESSVPVGEYGEFLGRPMMYLDHRGKEECDELVAKMGKSRIRAIAGSIPNESYTLLKMIWIKRHEDYFPKVKSFLLFEDFAGYMLTGEKQIGISLATKTMAYDIRKMEWSQEIFEAAGIDPGLMSRVAPAGSVIGQVIPALADELGVSRKMIVVNGGHDQFCAPLGCGMLDERVSTNGMGSTDAIHMVVPHKFSKEFAERFNYPETPYLKPGQFYTITTVETSGSMLKWYKDTFAQSMKIRLAAKDVDFYTYVEQIMGSDPSGVVTVPAFSGLGTPIFKTNTSGLIYGLKLSTTEGQVYRSMLEGIAYAELLNLELLETQGVHCGEIHGTGGGSLSATWMQIRADILNKRICATGKDACARAGMILSAVALKKYKSIDEAVARAVKLGDFYEPDQARRDSYLETYEIYKKLYIENYDKEGILHAGKS